VLSKSYSGEAISLIFSYSNGTDKAFRVCSLSMEAFKYRSLFKKRISDVLGSYFFVILGDETIY
jgi:molybdopterin synthase catalytic subunit